MDGRGAQQNKNFGGVRRLSLLSGRINSVPFVPPSRQWVLKIWAPRYSSSATQDDTPPHVSPLIMRILPPYLSSRWPLHVIAPTKRQSSSILHLVGGIEYTAVGHLVKQVQELPILREYIPILCMRSSSGLRRKTTDVDSIQGVKIALDEVHASI